MCEINTTDLENIPYGVPGYSQQSLKENPLGIVGSQFGFIFKSHNKH